MRNKAESLCTTKAFLGMPGSGFCLVLSSFLAVVPLQLAAGQEPVNSIDADVERGDDFSMVPLPWLLASSDLGVGPLMVLVLTGEDSMLEPYKYQALFVVARTNLGFENYAFKLDLLNFTPWDLRLKVSAGYMRNLEDRYFGYGNFHDTRHERNVESGKTPVGPNIPRSADLVQGDEVSLNRNFFIDPTHGLNPGRRYLHESQNKYYQFDSVQRSARVTVEKRLGATPWILRVGLEGGSYRVLSYNGDRENNNTIANIPTLLDMERPVGYDGTPKRRYVNFGELSLLYDTRPKKREMHPDEGIYAGVKIEGGGHGTGSHFTFYRTSAFANLYSSPFDEFLRKYDKELILSFRGLASESSGEVPFYLAQGLGSRSLRGYPSRQFIDNAMLLGGTELQFKFARAGDTDFLMFSFVEQGRVGAEWREMNNSGWHRAYGGGLGVFIGGNTLIEIAAGRSKHKDYYEVSIGHSSLLE